jgi:hypothetical protein
MMRLSLKKKGNDWMFWAVAFLLFCGIVGYVFYTFRYLVSITDTAFIGNDSQGALIEHFDFVKLEQALGNKAGLLPPKTP